MKNKKKYCLKKIGRTKAYRLFLYIVYCIILQFSKPISTLTHFLDTNANSDFYMPQFDARPNNYVKQGWNNF